jgi:myo-inositol-1(or 4)-monophosphatase
MLRPDLHEVQRLQEALRAAGAVALKTFRGNVRSWIKGRNSPVCEADIAVDALLHERLARSDLGWLSEESQDDRRRLNESRIYVVDPIDGTRAYLAGKPDWSICAAVVEHGAPVLAGIYAPVDDEMLIAQAGAGATCNGERIGVTDGPDLSGASIAAPDRYLTLLSATSDIVRIPKIHSLALRLTRVAQGRIDGAMASPNAHDWDLAAADLLVHEAGGVMTTLTGKRLVYNQHTPVHGPVIAAGRARHAAMCDVVRDRRGDFD